MTAQRITVFLPFTSSNAISLHDAIDNAFARETAPYPADQAVAAVADGGPLLLTVVQVGEQLALSESTVRDLLNRRDDPLPSVKIGTARRIRRDDLVAWLDRESGRGGAR